MVAGISPETFGSLLVAAVAGFVAIVKLAERIMRFGERFGFVRTPSAWKLEAEALVQRVDELAAELRDVKVENLALKAEIAELRGRPDFGLVVRMIERHESRSEETSREIVEALQRISGRLEAGA